MCVSKSFCNITPRCNFRCNLLVAVFFGVTSLRGFASLRECVWFLPTILVRFFSFLQDNFVHVSTRMVVTQASTEVMASLENPFKSTCHPIFSKCLCAWSSYLPSKSCSSSSRELKLMNIVCLSPLSPFPLYSTFFLPCLNGNSKNAEVWASWLSISGLTLILCVGRICGFTS